MNLINDSSEDFFDKLSSTMIERARDKVPQVRAQAAAAMCRLQVPDDENDPVTLQYLQLLSSDSNKSRTICYL